MTQVLMAQQPHVRFYPDCFLIPDTPCRPTRAHLEARTVALPISWSRRPNEADLNDPTFTPTKPAKLMVKIPSFTRRARVHSPERDSPLKSCIHSPDSPPRCIAIPLSPVTESVTTTPTGFPPVSSPRNAGLPCISPTVPLRPCCQTCYNKMLIACDENYVPRWSPGARRKKERDEKEALAWSPSEVHSIDLMLSAGYHPFVFGGARVDEVEVKRGKGAPTRLDVESEKTEEVTESDESDMLVSPVEHDVSIPFGPHKYPSVMSPSAEDRAFADILPVSICRPLQGERPISPPTTSPEKINGRRLSFTERSSLMLQACLRGGSTVLKSVASGEGNMNVKLL